VSPHLIEPSVPVRDECSGTPPLGEEADGRGRYESFLRANKQCGGGGGGGRGAR